MKTKTRHMVRIALLLMFVTLMLSASGTYAAGKSVTVKPTGKKTGADLGKIEKALKKYKVVKLKKGKTYYLSSPIHFRSNRTLDATGATIVCKKSIVITDLKKAGYANVKNVTIRGGTWKSNKSTGYKGTSFCFVHGSGITLQNMTIEHTNYNGHAIELVACKNVNVSGVTIAPRGTPNQSMECMLQIDIATDATYPRLKKTKLSNGAICQNVTVSGCNITGNRAVATGYSSLYKNNMHTNVQLLNNHFRATNGEGVFLENTKNAVVKSNTIEAFSGNLSADKSTGLHFLVCGNVGGTSLRCENNIVRGGKYAIRVYSKGAYPVGTVALLTNRCYCRSGAGNAIQAAQKGIASLTEQGNQTYSW